MEARQESDSAFSDKSGSFLENEKSAVMSKSFNQLTSPNQQNRRRTRASEINERLLNKNNDLLLQNENLKQLKINKLRFDSLQLVDREKDIRLLRSVVDRTMKKRTNGHKEVVFIGGYSGVGKSALANTLGDYVAPMEDGIFLRGKFGMNNCDEPYTAIAEAFNGFFEEMKEVQLKEEKKSNGTFADLRELLIAELGSELHLLANLIPSLEAIAQSRRRSIVQSQNDEAGHKRWKHAFRVLTRIVDLLITDKQNTNPLVVVGNFRSNEVDEEHIIFEKVQGLAFKQETYNFKLTDVQLSSLDVDDVNKVVMAMLSIDDPEKTRNLTDKCFKRTLGNPFFALEYMTLLEEEKLISFNFGLMSWTWDENEIESMIMPTANVVDLLKSRMKKLPEDTQMLLQYAACLGSTFKTSMVDLVWREHSSNNLSGDAGGLSSMLNVLEESNYIEKIGKVPRRPEFAELNLRAAHKARSISAFHSAAIFANNGIRLLPNDIFSSHRQLALEMNYAIGDIEQMEDCTETVLSQETCSTLDKFPLYLVKATKLTSADANFKETYILCKEVLKLLGCNLDPSRTLMSLFVKRKLLQTFRMVKKRKRGSYIELGQMSDKKDQAIMYLLARLGASAYFQNNFLMHVLTTCEMVQRTLNYGITEVSGLPFCALGIVSVALKQDYVLATELAETGLFLESMINTTCYC